MSVAKRGDGRFVVKFKDEEGRWRQRSFRPEKAYTQFISIGNKNSAPNNLVQTAKSVFPTL